jgi:glutamate---cysteine ligase / carboxylate-amine ligase
LLQTTIRDADQALISDVEYRRLFGLGGGEPVRAADVWNHLAQAVGPHARSQHPSVRPAVHALLEGGPLARRILSAVGPDPSRDQIAAVYRQLCDCLAAGRMFAGLE